MKFMNQKGISAIVIILTIVGVLVIGGGIWYWQSQKEKPTVCPQDTKLCPDGSYVSRIGPNCEFAACPEKRDETAHWKTYRNEEYGFEVKYPEDYKVKIENDETGLLIVRVENTQGISYYVITITQKTKSPKMSNFLSNPECYELIKTEEKNRISWNINRWKCGTGAEKNPISACHATQNYVFEISLDSDFETLSVERIDQILSTFKFIK